MKCKPQKWQEFTETVNFPELSKKLSSEQALSLSSCLACLNYFDQNLLAVAVESSLDEFSMQRFVMLWQKLKGAKLDSEFFENHVKKYCDSRSNQEKNHRFCPL